MARKLTAKPTVGFVLLLSLLVAGPALAAVDGSPHDLIAQGYDVVKVSVLQERCSRCHIPAAPALQGFLPDVPPVLAAAYGAASVLCFSCHDGTTIVSANVDASRSAFHPASHGTNLAGYEGLRSEAVGMPYISGKRMECVTCHEPHDNGHRPFLRDTIQKLCLACHSKYTEFGRGKDNRTGNHNLAPDPLGSPLAEAPLTIVEAFRTAFPSPYPAEGGKAGGGWHWDLGGHLDQGAGGGIGCGTCHAVHGDGTSPPVEKLLAVAPVNDVANLFCEGCHAGTRGDGMTEPPHPNPGGTTAGRTYHPVDNDEANGSGRSPEIREPAGWPFGGGSPRRLICTSCHAAHDALVETPLLRKPATAASFCEECHDQVPDYHHQVGKLAETACATKVPAATYGTERGLFCASCHRAHNAGRLATRETDYVPLLLASSRSGALCAKCHPADNPTCTQKKDYQASHFLGDPLESFNDNAPPLRLAPWPESGLTSYYADPEARGVSCLSCHAFRKGALVFGDSTKKRSHLLARSGSLVEWPDGGEAAYLCAGCHSVDPKTGEVKGHSHPMMNADITKLTLAVEPPATSTPTGKLNCDSCHRPHEAITRGGVYILEKVDGTNNDPQAVHPRIDYTSLCFLCHTGKY